MAACELDSIWRIETPTHMHTHTHKCPHRAQKDPTIPLTVTTHTHAHSQLIAAKKLHLVNCVVALTFSLVIK